MWKPGFDHEHNGVFQFSAAQAFSKARQIDIKIRVIGQRHIMTVPPAWRKPLGFGMRQALGQAYEIGDDGPKPPPHDVVMISKFLPKPGR